MIAALLLALAARADPAPLALQVEAQNAPQANVPTVAALEEAFLLELDGEALRLAAELLATDAGARDGRVHGLFARALFRSGREAEAEKALAGASVDAASAHELELARAWIALERDRLREVLRLLTQEAPDGAGRREARWPADPEACLLLGRALARSGAPGELEAADRFLRAFLELAPQHPGAPGAWHVLAQHALRRGAREEAERCAARARESGRWQGFRRARLIQRREAPDAVLPRLGLAKLWLAVDEPARALLELKELLRRHPESGDAQAPLAQALHGLGDAAGAVTAARRAAEHLLPRAAEELAAGHVGDGDAAALERAERTLDELLELEALPGEPRREALFLFARAALARGDAQAAAERHARYVEAGGSRPLE